MDRQLKERLVGAAVLALLAVLFVPVVLDGPDQAHTTRDIALPPADAKATPEQTYHFDLQTENPVPQTATEETAAPASQTAPPKVSTDVPSNTKPVVTEPVVEPEPEKSEPPAAQAADGWTVQVGSFSTQARAQRLQDELRGKQYSAFIVPFKDGSKQYYRVRVGPEPDRAAADALAKRLQAETGSAVRVVSPP